MGQNITWVAPYQFNQKLPFDIDYKVIGTFKEFYIHLLRFVNFKLFSELEMKYPPTDIMGDLFVNPTTIKTLQADAQKKFNKKYTESIE